MSRGFFDYLDEPQPVRVRHWAGKLWRVTDGTLEVSEDGKSYRAASDEEQHHYRRAFNTLSNYGSTP